MTCNILMFTFYIDIASVFTYLPYRVYRFGWELDFILYILCFQNSCFSMYSFLSFLICHHCLPFMNDQWYNVSNILNQYTTTRAFNNRPHQQGSNFKFIATCIRNHPILFITIKSIMIILYNINIKRQLLHNMFSYFNFIFLYVI